MENSAWLSLPLFSCLTETQKSDWRNRSLFKKLPEGHRLVRAGEPAKFVFTLLNGAVRLYHEGPSRSQMTALVYSGPAFLGPGETLPDSFHSHSMQTLKLSEVLVTPKDVFLGILRSCPAFAVELLHEMNVRLGVSARLEMAMAFLDVERRVAALLLSYAEVFGVTTGQSVCIAKPLETHDLANDLGVSRKSIQRAMHDLEEKNLVRRDGKLIYLRSLQGLTEMTGDAGVLVAASGGALSEKKSVFLSAG